MRGFDALRALLGYEYSTGSWFWAPVHRARNELGGKPFGGGKIRPVVLATPLGPEAILYPRSTQLYPRSTQPGGLQHDAHHHEPHPPCRINKPGWVKLAIPVDVDQSLLNDETYSCEEPEGSRLLDAIRAELRP